MNGATLLQALRETGGFTLDRHGPVTAGVAVALDPTASLAVPAAELTAQRVDAWLAEHAGTLALPGAAVGGWIDRETGTAWLDLVEVTTDLETAKAHGRERGQIAVYDLTQQVEVRL